MKFLLAFLFSVAAVHAGFHHSDEQFEHPRKVVWGTRSVGKAILGKTYHYPHITIKLPNVHDNSLPPGAKWPLNQKNLRGGYGIIKGYSNAGPIVKRPGFMNSISMRGIYPNIHADVLRTTNAVTKSVSKSLPQAVFGKAIKVGRYGIAAHHAPVFHEAPKVLKPTYGEAVHYDLGQGEYGQDTSAHAENYGAPIYRQKESRYAGSADSDFLAVLSSYSNEESSGYRSPQTVIDSGYGSQQGAAYAAPSGQSGYGAPLSHDNSVEQLGGYAAHEQSGFVTDQSGYDAPQGGYDAPQVGYDASQVGYDAPQAGYDAPQAGYDAPQTGYDAPQVGYDAPQAGYDAPQAGYDAPQVGFNAREIGYQSSQYDAPQLVPLPESAYGAPQYNFGGSSSVEQFGATQSGYEAPQSGYQSPQSGYQSPQSGYQSPQSSYQSPQYDARQQALPVSGYDALQAGLSGSNSAEQFGETQSGYGAPQSGYQSPQSGYQSPQYDTPQQGFLDSGYGASHSSFSGSNSAEQFGATQSGYGAPQSGYQSPQSGYQSPQYDIPEQALLDSGYGASQSSFSGSNSAEQFGPTQSRYEAPQSGYEAPQSRYEASQSGYEAPQSGYEAPQSGYEAPQSGYQSFQSGSEIGYDRSQDRAVAPVVYVGYRTGQDAYQQQSQYVESEVGYDDQANRAYDAPAPTSYSSSQSLLGSHSGEVGSSYASPSVGYSSPQQPGGRYDRPRSER